MISRSIGRRTPDTAMRTDELRAMGKSRKSWYLDATRQRMLTLLGRIEKLCLFISALSFEMVGQVSEEQVDRQDARDDISNQSSISCANLISTSIICEALCEA
jgi:hypothetical protein